MKHALYDSNTYKGQNDLEHYFKGAGFIDLLPLAIEITGKLGFGKAEAIDAICKTYDKSKIYPPTINRRAWFEKVYREKLMETRADILAAKERWR